MNLRDAANCFIGGGLLCVLAAGCGGTTEPATEGAVSFQAQPLVVLTSDRAVDLPFGGWGRSQPTTFGFSSSLVRV